MTDHHTLYAISMKVLGVDPKCHGNSSSAGSHFLWPPTVESHGDDYLAKRFNDPSQIALSMAFAASWSSVGILKGCC
jgi:hypothetical protein